MKANLAVAVPEEDTVTKSVRSCAHAVAVVSIMSSATGSRFSGKASVAAALAQNFVMFVFIVIAFFNVMMMFVVSGAGAVGVETVAEVSGAGANGVEGADEDSERAPTA